MRISDWSSDVCSSDLAIRHALAGSRNYLSHGSRNRRPRAVGSLSPQQGISGRICRAHREYPRRARLSRRGVRLRLRHSTDLLEERLHHEPRSEEHTSELQSLMRISYAVFCLKKKTNTITNK